MCNAQSSKRSCALVFGRTLLACALGGVLVFLYLPSIGHERLPKFDVRCFSDVANFFLINIQSTNTTQNKEHDHSYIFPWQTATFLAMCLYVFVFLLRVVVTEHCRYSGNNGAMQTSHAFDVYLGYRFKHWYAWTPSAPGIVLCSLSWALLLTGAVLLYILTGAPISESLWAAWIWIAAPDGGGSAQDPVARGVGVLVSCGGMLIFALLMSFISSTVEGFLQNLRSGKGIVVESKHMVILGWSPILPILLGELCIAAESRGGAVFVLLTQLPKPELEDWLQDQGVDFKNSTVVVRSGQENCKEDLVKVAVQSASKVVILSRPGLSREDADAWSLNVLVSLCNLTCIPDSVRVLQCELVRNQQLCKSLSDTPIEVITAGDFVGTLMVQCSRQRGLAGVINSIFAFDGDEFYIHHVKGTQGMFFRDVLFAFEDVVTCGFETAEGVLQLLPPMDTKLQGDESLILLAEDASTLPDSVPFRRTKSTSELRAAVHEYSGTRIQCAQAKEARREVVVIIGFNESIGAVLTEIDKSIASGSEVVMFSPQSEESRSQFVKNAQKRRQRQFTKFSMIFQTGSLAARFKMESLPLAQASKVFILADSSSSPSEVTAQTVASILQVQSIIKESFNAEGSVAEPALIVPQILDESAEKSCIQLGVNDYINSNELAARLLAAVAESPNVSGIISHVIADDGCDFVIRSLDEYVWSPSLEISATGAVTFDEVMAAAAMSDEVALGWSEIHGGSCGPWEMNPKDRCTKRPWSKDARIIALKHSQPREGVASGASKRWWGSSCMAKRW